MASGTKSRGRWSAARSAGQRSGNGRMALPGRRNSQNPAAWYPSGSGRLSSFLELKQVAEVLT
jgi:hypothetical protein